ncbi:MAG: winged helix-turn-helix domain-containing protein [Chloroflexota bacterium]
MSAWDEYPETYRHSEVQQITRAICTGECAALLGLSGSGKSNLVGFLANRVTLPAACPRLAPVDCNRLPEPSPAAFWALLVRALERLDPPLPGAAGEVDGGPSPLDALERLLEQRLQGGRGVCLLLDRFDALYDLPGFRALAGNLRALRDRFKYRLTYLTAARRPLDPTTELAELFFGCTVWLGPLSPEDAAWSARRDLQRYGTQGSEANLARLVELSWGYPSLLRGACEAFAAGAELSVTGLGGHPAVARRAAEFWSDRPGVQLVQVSRLEGHPWLARPAAAAVGQNPGPPADGPAYDPARLTAKEHLLLQYMQAHAGQVCEKDALVQAIWPEDVIFEQGVRDESLAQLVRRLRVKIERDPAAPQFIHTVPGRGYLFRLE